VRKYEDGGMRATFRMSDVREALAESQEGRGAPNLNPSAMKRQSRKMDCRRTAWSSIKRFAKPTESFSNYCEQFVRDYLPHRIFIFSADLASATVSDFSRPPACLRAT
jgi:hypothetical protein